MEGAILCHENGNCLCRKPGHHSWYNNQTMDWTVWGSISIISKRFFFSSPKCSAWVWGSPSFLFNEY